MVCSPQNQVHSRVSSVVFLVDQLTTHNPKLETQVFDRLSQVVSRSYILLRCSFPNTGMGMGMPGQTPGQLTRITHPDHSTEEHRTSYLCAPSPLRRWESTELSQKGKNIFGKLAKEKMIVAGSTSLLRYLDTLG